MQWRVATDGINVPTSVMGTPTMNDEEKLARLVECRDRVRNTLVAMVRVDGERGRKVVLEYERHYEILVEMIEGLRKGGKK